MTLPAVRMHSFGCRLNQLETEAAALAFSRAGFPVSALEAGEGDQDGLPSSRAGDAARAFPSMAQGSLPPIVFINTCTVTSKAEQKARRIIRSALRSDPRAVVIVSGCYAEMEGAEVGALGERVVVLPGSRKDALLALPGRLAEAASALGHGDWLDAVREELAALSGGERDPFAFRAADFRFHSRASLKVQDGCDNACSFCRVHLARGASVSLPPEEALARARELEAAGWAEIVLTGVNLSQYRRGELTLGGLLSLLHGGTERVAFRLSSFEPDRMDAAFLQAASLPRLRPFFHFPLQSASPALLSRMGRDPSGSDALESAIARIRGLRGDPFISYDLIAGFPGETEADFRITRDFVERTAPASLHVFTFSPRPGTPAASFRPAVPERVAVERAAELMRLSGELRAAYVSRWTGRTVQAVLEGRPSREGLPRRAFSENALSVGLLEDPGAPAGSALVLRCRAAPETGEFDLWGECAGA